MISHSDFDLHLPENCSFRSKFRVQVLLSGQEIPLESSVGVCLVICGAVSSSSCAGTYVGGPLLPIPTL